MSREIKFRAWDTVMRDWVPMGLNEISEQVFIKPSGSNGKFSIETFDSKANRHILMQFTGLHDKNGKKIYEGDIVKCGKQKAEIVFEFGAFRYKWTDGAVFDQNHIANLNGNRSIVEVIEASQ